MKKKTNISIPFDNTYNWPTPNMGFHRKIPKILRDHGLKATDARKDLLNLFHKYKIPLTAEMIAKRFFHRDFKLSTIYRILESFERKGLIRRVDLRTNSIFYEINEHHHHHIVCQSCGIIEEIEGCFVDKIIPKSKKFAMVNEHTLEFFGKCKSCTKS